MKIIIIDISHNSSITKVRAFLNHHSDAEKVFTFDAISWEYSTVEDLEEDLDECPDEFFSKPCAYYDLVVAILGKVRKTCADSIIVYSPQIDDCSRLSSEFLFDNFIRHFEMYNPGILDINYSNLEYIPRLVVKVKNPLKDLLSRFSLPRLELFGLDNDSDDYDDFYSAS